LKKLEKTAKLLLIVLALIILIVTLVVILLPPSLTSDNNPTAQYYNLNQEITAFPTTNTSITFTSWTYTSRFDIFEASESTNIIILNFTLKNIANNEIKIRPNLQYSNDTAPFTPREAPLLKYGDDYAEAKTEIPYAHYWRLWKTQTNLISNESINGCLLYEIPKEHTPTELVYPNKDSPKIIIRLK
jgi:hypothetical protein